MTSPDGLVPVTVLGGYLGAGKTTLVNNLLTNNHGRRLAVLVNDFGAVNIDVDLIVSHDGDTISLKNGCVCCSISDALGESLDRVLALDPQPDQIVIEASGVADPAKIASYGYGWPGCRMDAVIVLADVETIQDKAKDQFVGELIIRQLRGADLVLVTKSDLVSEDALNSVICWAADIAAVPVTPVSHGDIDPKVVLDLSSFDLDAKWEPQTSHDADSIRSAEDMFETATLELSRPLDRSRLEEALALWPQDVMRVKGIVRFSEDCDCGAELHVVQRVGLRWSIEPTLPNTDLEDSGGRLMVVVRRAAVDATSLISGLVDG
ncbi:MAG: GTP-binding protein [Acidimicrobiales bacterium]|jgi:G3E family GTPase|nr:GTP-binding protein [Acidimicrobiales bacterium]MDP6901120.1 GTP-binding protein [Acidimicrobiales bacterium]HJM00313.1 GTP-binding protein [Acidimicrobiales bacterium]